MKDMKYLKKINEGFFSKNPFDLTIRQKYDLFKNGILVSKKDDRHIQFVSGSRSGSQLASIYKINGKYILKMYLNSWSIPFDDYKSCISKMIELHNDEELYMRYSSYYEKPKKDVDYSNDEIDDSESLDDSDYSNDEIDTDVNDLNNIRIRKMIKKDVKKCLDIKYQYFGHFYGNVEDEKTKEKHDKYVLDKLDLSVSLVAELPDGTIVGGYFLKKTNLPEIIGNFYDFKGDKSVGIEGVSLFVHPDYKSLGIGHKLKYFYKDNDEGIDFIWGQAYHDLDNIQYWLKNRTLFNDKFGVYFTIEIYSNKEYEPTPYLDFYNKNNSLSIMDVSLFFFEKLGYIKDYNLVKKITNKDKSALKEHILYNYDFKLTDNMDTEIVDYFNSWK